MAEEPDVDWSEHINHICYALRICPQKNMKYPPYEILFGFEPLLVGF